MQDTGERHIPDDAFYHEADYYVHLMHIATYHFALKFIKDKQVLDYGCGAGYGALLLAGAASHVTASDISNEAVTFAHDHYAAPNLDYVYMHELGKKKFDVITSFQVIEHIADTKTFLNQLVQMLKPGGIVLLSTPDKSNRLVPFIQKPWNKFHLKEFSAATLKRSASSCFNDVQILKITSSEPFVRHEISRCRKNKWVCLPCTLFFYPNAVRVFLLGVQSDMYAGFNRLRKRKHEKVGLQETTGHPFLKYTVEDIVIAPDPPYPTDLIAVCRKADNN